MLGGKDSMTKGLDIIILDDEPIICESISEILNGFYTWGEIHSFTDISEAISYTFTRDIGIGIFIVDIYLREMDGFRFIDAIKPKFPNVYKDIIMITGYASVDLVNICLASGINYLLEKPIKQYELHFAVRSILEKYIRIALNLDAIRSCHK